MKKLNYTTLAIIGVVVLVVVICISWYASARNGFVALDENVNKQWSQVQNQYQARLQLIPDMVSTAKAWASHESDVYGKVAAARQGLEQATNAAQQTPGADASAEAVARYDAAQQQLTRALQLYINAVHEAYPDLKDETFLNLQTELTGCNRRIATERKRYIDAVQEYNVAVRSFPGSIVASMSGFAVRPQFEADPEANQNSMVNFD